MHSFINPLSFTGRIRIEEWIGGGEGKISTVSRFSSARRRRRGWGGSIGWWRFLNFDRHCYILLWPLTFGFPWLGRASYFSRWSINDWVEYEFEIIEFYVITWFYSGGRIGRRLRWPTVRDGEGRLQFGNGRRIRLWGSRGCPGSSIADSCRFWSGPHPKDPRLRLEPLPFLLYPSGDSLLVRVHCVGCTKTGNLG